MARTVLIAGLSLMALVAAPLVDTVLRFLSGPTYESYLKGVHGVRLPAEENRRRCEAIAEKVYRRYRELKYLSFEAECRGGGVTVWVKLRMAPRRLRTEVYHKGKLGLVLWLKDGVFHEWNAAAGRAIQYAPDHPNGCRGLRLSGGVERFACIYGNLLQNWVGPEAVQPDRFRDGISVGRYLGTRRVGERVCDVVEWRRHFNTPSGPYDHIHLFCVESSGLLTAWFQWESTDKGPFVFRISEVYHGLNASPIPDQAWAFEPPLAKAGKVPTRASHAEGRR